MQRYLILLSLVLVTIGMSAAPIELDRAAATMSGTEANFTHTFTARGFKNSQVESGSVIFGALPAMRWNYAKPESKLFVFDGSNTWFYIPADRQVTVGKIDQARKNELPFLLLGDPAARERHFVVKEQKRGKTIVTTLQARNKAALVKNVTVTIDPASHLIQKIEYADRDGNRTAFAFSGYHRRAAAAGTFTFTPPAGVQVIRAN